MSSIISLGAYDRFNYGDLLFPHMIDRVAAGEVRHASIAGGDLLGVGGHSTQAIRGLMKSADGEPAAIIVGGGDVVTASWFAVDWQLRPGGFDLAYRVARRTVPMRFLNVAAKIVRGSDWDRPFLPPKRLCNRIPVVYHAVGGSNISALPSDEQKNIAGDLQGAKLITVRDHVTEAALHGLGIACDLAPDSVAAMALDSPNQDERHEKRHIIIQTSDNWLRHRAESFCGVINHLMRAGYAVSFLPIGLAAGHSDLTAFQRMSALSPGLGLIEVNNTGDIKAAISDASLFIGTSLHGHITAVALGTPCVALKGVSKLEAYVATWTERIAPVVTGDEALLDAVEQVLAASQAHRDDLRMQLGERAESNTRVCVEALYEG